MSNYTVQAKHVSDDDKLIVTKSHEQKQYPAPSTEQTINARPDNFKPEYYYCDILKRIILSSQNGSFPCNTGIHT